MAWAGDEEKLHLSLLSGSVLFVGGRRSGTTHVARALVERLKVDDVVTTKFVDLSMLPAPGAPEDVLREVLPPSTHEGLDRQDLAGVCMAVDRMLKTESKRLHVVVIDRFDLIVKQEWAFALTVTIRSLLSACGALRLAAFCRPRTVDILGGESSPLVNMMKLVRATRADPNIVRDDLGQTGHTVDDVMRGYRIAGGLPYLICPAAELFSRGMTSNEVVAAMAASEADYFLRQHEDLTTAAKRIVRLLSKDGSRGMASISHSSGVDDVAAALDELAAYTLVECKGGEWSLTCPVHQLWCQTSVGLISTRQPRPPLTAGDETAYRQLSQLEWLARDWLDDRLTRVMGTEWWESAIPAVIRQRVEERQAFEHANQHVAAGEHLVDYLDFSDFREILRLRDVWRKAFAGTSVEEWRDRLFDALERLEAVRRKVAHSRPLTGDEIAKLSVDSATVRDIIVRSA